MLSMVTPRTKNLIVNFSKTIAIWQLDKWNYCNKFPLMICQLLCFIFVYILLVLVLLLCGIEISILSMHLNLKTSQNKKRATWLT